MTDQLDDLFRDLRAETLTTVRPPGTAAARSTLRRRRRNRTAGAAACLAVAGIGGVGTHLLGPARTPDVGDRPVRAAAAIGPRPDARFSGQGAVQTGVLAQGLVLAGRYTLTLSCVGRGRVTLSIRINGGDLAEASVWCTAAGAVASRMFTLPDTLRATVEMQADPGAESRAGYAYSMVLAERERWDLRQAAAGTLPPAQGEVLSKWDMPAVAAAGDVVLLGAGSYRLTYACAGAGSVGLRMQAPETTSYTSASCANRPLRYESVAFGSRHGGRFVADVVPDADADRQSSFVFRLERLG